MSTQDGRRLHVLHPGFWNREPGPDFLRALIQFEGGEIRAGDVELDRIPSGWRSHRHDGNPSYRRVILRVVWEAPLRGEREEPPVMVMKPVLDAPVPELLGWLSLEGPSALPVNVPGLCSAPLGKLPVDKAIEILQQAALSRLSRKAAELEARARHAGWEQVLWEGMAAGLGYKHNVWPMRRLAELMPWAPMEGAGSTPECLVPIQARLLGLGSFLTRPENRVMPDAYVRSLWDSWWRDREEWGSLGFGAWLESDLRTIHSGVWPCWLIGGVSETGLCGWKAGCRNRWNPSMRRWLWRNYCNRQAMIRFGATIGPWGRRGSRTTAPCWECRVARIWP